MLQAEIFTEVDIQNSSVAETSIKNMNNSFSVSGRMCHLYFYAIKTLLHDQIFFVKFPFVKGFLQIYIQNKLDNEILLNKIWSCKRGLNINVCD